MAFETTISPAGGRLADRVYGQVLEFIVEQDLREGDRLPSENELSRLTGVSRPIVREALNRLQGDGLVEARRGAGSYLRQRPGEHLVQHLRPAEVAQRLQAFELRIPLEVEAARLAALRRSEAQLARIESESEHYRAELLAGRSGAEHDVALHRAIAEATGNPVFVSGFDQLERASGGLIVASLSLLGDGGRERVEMVAREHGAVVHAIVAGEGDQAAAAMQLHLLSARNRIRTGRF